jgi:uncharacterized protein YneR
LKSPVAARIFVSSLLIGFIISGGLNAQTITGAWRGKLGTLKTELKLIKKGDSLTGTSYYYTNKTHYRRYSIKGYFDPETNNVIWWDDVLLEEKGTTASNNREPFLSVADFNCPGEEKMLLEGKATDKDDKDKSSGPVNMQKVATSIFSDEWDYVLDNYFVGANHPDIIDSVSWIAFVEPPIPVGFEGTLTPPVLRSATPEPATTIKITSPEKKDQETKTPAPDPAPAKPQNKTLQSIEQKYTSRKNKLQTVIPVTSDKIELRFYDNAQVDGDSIALFLNDKLLYKNIRLTDQAYTVFINASDLQADNELVMVAENLGSIPPNTSFMVAIVGDKRYEARLYANENSSALIRFVKQE